jgi:hypothetical protein
MEQPYHAAEKAKIDPERSLGATRDLLFFG